MRLRVYVLWRYVRDGVECLGMIAARTHSAFAAEWRNVATFAGTTHHDFYRFGVPMSPFAELVSQRLSVSHKSSARDPNRSVTVWSRIELLFTKITGRPRNRNRSLWDTSTL